MSKDSRLTTPNNKPRPFEMNYALENNMFKVSIGGRLDSLTAPQLLTAWEKIKTTSMPVGAEMEKLFIQKGFTVPPLR